MWTEFMSLKFYIRWEILAQSHWAPLSLCWVSYHFLQNLSRYLLTACWVPATRLSNRFYLPCQSKVAKVRLQLAFWLCFGSRHPIQIRTNVSAKYTFFRVHPKWSKSSARRRDWFGYWIECLPDTASVVIQPKPLWAIPYVLSRSRVLHRWGILTNDQSFCLVLLYFALGEGRKLVHTSYLRLECRNLVGLRRVNTDGVISFCCSAYKGSDSPSASVSKVSFDLLAIFCSAVLQYAQSFLQNFERGCTSPGELITWFLSIADESVQSRRWYVVIQPGVHFEWRDSHDWQCFKVIRTRSTW